MDIILFSTYYPAIISNRMAMKFRLHRVNDVKVTNILYTQYSSRTSEILKQTKIETHI